VRLMLLTNSLMSIVCPMMKTLSWYSFLVLI
jgi:hypothetical protein